MAEKDLPVTDLPGGPTEDGFKLKMPWDKKDNDEEPKENPI